jgi:hypothetical protein
MKFFYHKELSYIPVELHTEADYNEEISPLRYEIVTIREGLFG